MRTVGGQGPHLLRTSSKLITDPCSALRICYGPLLDAKAHQPRTKLLVAAKISFRLRPHKPVYTLRRQERALSCCSRRSDGRPGSASQLVQHWIEDCRLVHTCCRACSCSTGNAVHSRCSWRSQI